jgi:hypothetical protein
LDFFLEKPDFLTSKVGNPFFLLKLESDTFLKAREAHFCLEVALIY